MSTATPQENEKPCRQCKQIKPLLAFSRLKGKADGYKEICDECQGFNQQERHRRVAAQRAMWLQGQEREDRRQMEWARRVALRQAQETRWQELENWYLQQPDRRCRACQQLLPASAFDSTSSANGFVLYTRCKACHALLLERRQVACCMCQKKTLRVDFISQLKGYALCGMGTSLSLCCKRCEASFLALPEPEQRVLIRSCCERTFPIGQVIYAEVDPETHEIRYVGRTSKPKRRHAQHLLEAASVTNGADSKVCHTRSSWIQTLAERGLKPCMRIIRSVEVSPYVAEWEQRYIWYGIQQGWNLLNCEAANEALVARIKNAHLDFLNAPFETLVQQNFFPAYGFAYFLRTWYESEYVS
ncbi:hypothetical protein EPA93_18110 [Ktedonosporobacter rubrisoli]|uniref:GIY-YIG domain-containing protein n=1 Tax=Ktedonosporobacter rubrisoli TaxID=2509675 RepID=A0A4P6JR86_KTERU|nr:hypothetical protein [Ktedonosporobacter rubrisoli]QBD77803.1 hypothetical protein EPA93_18110 [Ktedonosporobacter rubrisoli]